MSKSVENNLTAYALVAGAAGVAMLACATPADAAPVCKSPNALLAYTATFGLSLPGQPVAAFNVAQSYHTFSTLTSTGINRGFFTRNLPGAEVLVSSQNMVAGLPLGATIGPGGRFGKGASYGLIFTFIPDYGATSQHHRGNLRFGQTSYFGFTFLISGQAHYGWVSLQSTIITGRRMRHVNTAILAYGYESTPNMAIAAGSCGTQQETRTSAVHDESAPSLGALALGSQGLTLWRKP